MMGLDNSGPTWTRETCWENHDTVPVLNPSNTEEIPLHWSQKLRGNEKLEPKLVTCEQANKLISVGAGHLLFHPKKVRVTVFSWRMKEWQDMAGLAFDLIRTEVSLLLRSLIDENGIWKGRKRDMVLGTLGRGNK